VKSYATKGGEQNMKFLKSSKYWALVLGVIIGLFFLTGCSNDATDTLATEKYDVNFTVVDKMSTYPVSGAEITLAGEKEITNLDGKVSFKREDGSYDYNVKAIRYNQLQGKIVVNGENTFKDLELEITASGDDGDSIPAEDITPPVFQNLYAVVGGSVYGVVDPEINFKKITESDQCVILHFSEPVIFGSFDRLEDFEIQIIADDSEKSVNIKSFAEVSNYPDYLVIEIEAIEKTGVIIKLTISNSGRQKISDLANNLLEEVPEFQTVNIL